MDFLLQLINGLRIGSIYALVALGYTMVYGVLQLINFAHGDLMMIGAYAAFFSLPFLIKLGLPIWMSVLFAILATTLLGLVIERVAYKPLRNSPRISNLITAIGVSLLLQNSVNLFIGSGAKSFPTVFTQNPFRIGSLSIGFGIVITVTITLLTTLLLQVFMTRTKFGKTILATSQDENAARLMGINVDTVISITFAIGSGIAGIGSVLYLAAYPQISPTMGAMLGIKAFIAAVIGGIGHIPGAVLGGFILGILETLTKAYLPSQLSDAIVFGILIIVLLIRPTGFFGREMREKV